MMTPMISSVRTAGETLESPFSKKARKPSHGHVLTYLIFHLFLNRSGPGNENLRHAAAEDEEEKRAGCKALLYSANLSY